MTGINQALVDFQSKVAPIHKLSTAQYGAYADLQTVIAAIQPALTECGLAITQTFCDDTLVTTLRHVSGEFIDSAVALCIGDNRNPLHAWGGAVTYQRRYSILSILCLAAGIEDDDGYHRMTPASSISRNDDFI